MNSFLSPDDTKIWYKTLDEINKFHKTDIYFEINYIKIHLKKNSHLKAFIYKNKNKIFFFPIIISKIHSAPEYFDFQSVYGYSGPLANTNSKIFLDKSWKIFVEQLTKKNIIAGFIRFHPFIENHKYLLNLCNILIYPIKKIVFLNKNIDDIYLSKNALRNLKKKEKYKITFSDKVNKKNIVEFSKLYSYLMDKKSANEMYKFDDIYFLNLFKFYKKNVFLKLAKRNNDTIGGIIFSVYNNYLNILWSAMSKKGLKMGVSYMLRNEVINQYDNVEINFGGGITSQINDSLLEFKKNFSKKTKDFYIGKVIVNEKVYNKLIIEWGRNNKKNEFNHYHLKYNY